MRRIFLFVTTLVMLEAQAQDLKSKKGENYLPQAKDCALQFDAVPFLNYTGRLLSTNGSTSPTVTGQTNFPLTIGGKYFKTANFAYRAKARIGLTSQTIKNSIINNQKTTTDTIFTSDSKTIRKSNITLSFGFEKRRGNTRLQGYYGGEAFLTIGSGSTKYSYGNQISKDYPSVYTTDFNNQTPTGFSSSLSSKRITLMKDGATVGLGVRAFLGAEYFIFPKISLAAELGWGFSYINTNDGYYTTERFDATNQTVRANTPISGNNIFGIDTDNSGGQLMMTFHF